MTKFKTGQLIKFEAEKRPYRIIATDGEKFAICIKSHPKKDAYLYTMVDTARQVRGPDVYWKWGGRYSLKNNGEPEKALAALISGKDEYGNLYEVSYKNFVKLDIEKIYEQNRK